LISGVTNDAFDVPPAVVVVGPASAVLGGVRGGDVACGDVEEQAAVSTRRAPRPRRILRRRTGRSVPLDVL
jgi:hypothetical protein